MPTIPINDKITAINVYKNLAEGLSGSCDIGIDKIKMNFIFKDYDGAADFCNILDDLQTKYSGVISSYECWRVEIEI